MGINIEGFIVENNKNTIEQIAEKMGIEIKPVGKICWNEAEAGSMRSSQFAVFERNKTILIHNLDEIYFENRDLIISYLEQVQKGVLYAMNETSMSFGFEWFENGKPQKTDFYIFEEEFMTDGPNYLNLDEDSDIFFDGLLPMIENKLGLKPEDELDLYEYQFLPKQKPEQPKSLAKIYEEKANEGNTLIELVKKSAVKDPIAYFDQLIKISKELHAMNPNLDMRAKRTAHEPLKTIEKELGKLARSMKKGRIDNLDVQIILLPYINELANRNKTASELNINLDKKWWQFG